jgi:hypothetical protein
MDDNVLIRSWDNPDYDPDSLIAARREPLLYSLHINGEEIPNPTYTVNLTPGTAPLFVLTEPFHYEAVRFRCEHRSKGGYMISVTVTGEAPEPLFAEPLIPAPSA